MTIVRSFIDIGVNANSLFATLLDNKNPYGTDVDKYYYSRLYNNSLASIVYLRVSFPIARINTILSTGVVLFVSDETYPKSADFSGVAAVGILFLSLEQNGGE